MGEKNIFLFYFSNKIFFFVKRNRFFMEKDLPLFFLIGFNGSLFVFLSKAKPDEIKEYSKSKLDVLSE